MFLLTIYCEKCFDKENCQHYETFQDFSMDLTRHKLRGTLYLVLKNCMRIASGVTEQLKT